LLTVSYSKLTLVDSHPPDRAPQSGAQRTIQSFSSSQHSSGRFVPDAGVSTSLPARPVLGHTVKELPSRGLKSRSGGFAVAITAIDVLSLGRPRSWRPAKLLAHTRTRQSIFRTFFAFFGEGGKCPPLRGLRANYDGLRSCFGHESGSGSHGVGTPNANPCRPS
jgi:hypothetical protein